LKTDTQALLDQLKSTPLLSRIGQSHRLPHRQVGSWHEALELCDSEKWSALQLMTKNRNAGEVNRLNWDRCQSWNAVCAALRPEIAKIVDGFCERLGNTHKPTTDLKASVSWDILGVLLEREFDDVTTPAFYIPVLLPIYQAGHLPCGWTGPKLDTYWSSGSAALPTGEILIY
jgi:hypothetical protein